PISAVRTDGTSAEASRNTVVLAQHADRWGFTRFWLAELHKMPGIAGAATSVLIGHLEPSRSTLLHQRGSAHADFLERQFEATKFLRAQFREHSLHLPGMLSEG